MPTSGLDARADWTRRATRGGGIVARRVFRTGIVVETRGRKTDMVTQAGRDAQRRVVERIRDVFPNEPTVGEEEDEYKSVLESRSAWAVGPIDGTNNFICNVPVWMTAVAVAHDDDLIAAVNYLPALDDRYVADDETAPRNGEGVSVSQRGDLETYMVYSTFWWDYDVHDEYAAVVRAIVTRSGDLRRYGSMRVVLSYVADGLLDGATTNKRVNPWDLVTDTYLIRMAGDTVIDLDSNAWRHDSEGLVVLNGHAYGVVLEITREIGGQ